MARDILIRLNKLTAAGKVPADDAVVRFTPTILRADADGITIPEPFPVELVNGEATAQDVPTTDLNWAYFVQIINGRRGTWSWYVHVPEGTPDPETGEVPAVNFEDLPRIDPATMTPVNDPDPAWVDAVTSVFSDTLTTELQTQVPTRMVTEIDDESSEFRSRLNAAIGQVAGLGADGAVNRQILQAAVDQGGKWYIPTGLPEVPVAGTVDLTVPGTVIYTGGVPFRQTINGETIFNTKAEGLRFKDPLILHGVAGLPDFSPFGGPWEGSTQASRWCGVNVYANSHGLNIEHIEGYGMSAALRSGGWDPATDAEATYRTDDIEIGTVIADRVEFGVALKATNRVVIGEALGTYGNTISAPRPPHLLYFAPSGAGGPGHLDPTVRGGTAQDGLGGHAFQIKGVTGGTFGPLHARNCRGLLNFMDAKDVHLTELVSWADTFDSTQGGAVTFDQTTETSGVTIGRARIDMASNGKAFYIINGDHITTDEMKITTHHTTRGSAEDYDVTVAGHHNEVRGLSVVNTGPNAWKAAGVWGDGEGNRIQAHELTGVRVGLDGRTSPDAVLEYDAERITLHPTDGLYPLTKSASLGASTFRAPQTTVLRNGAVLADNFTVGAGSNSQLAAALTGQPWSVSSGTWHIGTDGAYVAADTNAQRAFIDAGVQNVRVEAFIKHNTTNGLAIKATQDQASYLWFDMAADGLHLKSGPNPAMATQPFTFQNGRVYKVAATYYAGEVSVFIDGALILSHTLSTADADIFNTATKVGMRTSRAATRFRDLQVQAI